MSNTEIAIYDPINKETVKGQIFEVRGVKVMLDKDIAVYFGVTTGNLNKAMKRNIKRFPESFCFQLTNDECSRFQIGILNGGRGSNIKYLPFVYTEQGVAMLTSVLHTDKAIDAGIQIMETFVEMSHFIRQNAVLLPQQEIQLLSLRQDKLQAEIKDIKESMVAKSDLSDLIKLFDAGIQSEEVLILDGEPFKADLAYQRIYQKAEKSIIVVDDYLGIRTLHHLACAKMDIDITIISDNKGYNPLRLSEYDDFITEYPRRKINFIQSDNLVHDRFIVLDYGLNSMKIYLCGASSKDAGKRITVITELKAVNVYQDTIKRLLDNLPLVLS